MSLELEMQVGYVLSVSDIRESGTLTADVEIGATEIEIDNLDPFSEDGGTAVLVRDDKSVRDTITYTGIDEDLSQLVGVAGIDSTFSEDDRVLALPKTTTRYAAVVESEEDAAIDVRVPHALYPYLNKNTRTYSDGSAVRVLFFWDGNEFVAFDVLGAVPAFDAQFIVNAETGLREQIFRYRCDPATTGRSGLLKVPHLAGTIRAVRLLVVGSETGGCGADFQVNGVTFQTVTIPSDSRDSGLWPVEQSFDSDDTFGVVQGDMSALSPGTVLYAEFRVRKSD